MSRPKHDWWQYAKGMTRRYPDYVNNDEERAVKAAIENTLRLKDGEERLRVIRMVYWNGKNQRITLQGAALQIPCSYETAQNWHADFIREVGRNFSCKGLKPKRKRTKKSLP